MILLTPSTCNPEALLIFLQGLGIVTDDTGKSNETSRQYANAVLDVGRSTGCPTIDLYKLFEEQCAKGVKDDELFTDGLHYTPKAYAVCHSPIRFFGRMSRN